MAEAKVAREDRNSVAGPLTALVNKNIKNIRCVKAPEDILDSLCPTTADIIKSQDSNFFMSCPK